MTTLSLNGAGYTAQSPLFRNLTFTFGPGDRVGLVAQNGAGKTTLLRCLAGDLELSEGTVIRSRGLRVGFVPQDVDASLKGLSLHDAVLSALDAETRANEGWRAGMVLDTMGAPGEMRERRVDDLSGGWQRLMLLARAWVCDPDALLMDEPTNHLDLEKILMLERWLETWAHDTLVIVASHDRSFLDAVTNRTLFLRPGTSRLYPLAYGKARDELARADHSDATEQARELHKARQLRRQSAKLKNIGINSGSDLMLKKQKQLRERAERIEAAATPLHAERNGDIRLSNQGTHAKVLVRMEDMPVPAPDGRRLFDVRALDIAQGDRIVVLGRNGTGKSTLLRLLRHALQGGETPGVKATPTLALGCMDYELSEAAPERTPFDLVARYGEGDARTRALLAAAGIAHEKQTKPVGTLSLGQRSRLALLALRLAGPNFYLLDEPTNHLDIAGQETLAEEIRRHGATCMLVSHDRAFVREVGTRFLVLDGGRLSEHETPEPWFASLAPAE